MLCSQFVTATAHWVCYLSALPARARVCPCVLCLWATWMHVCSHCMCVCCCFYFYYYRFSLLLSFLCESSYVCEYVCACGMTARVLVRVLTTHITVRARTSHYISSVRPNCMLPARPHYMLPPIRVSRWGSLITRGIKLFPWWKYKSIIMIL